MIPSIQEGLGSSEEPSRGGMPQSRICLFGPSGSGKSTVAELLRQEASRRGETLSVLKLAEPLYELQREFYSFASASEMAEGKQDQALLMDIATHLRRINKYCLIVHFGARLEREAAGIVVNDDLRDVEVDYPRLRELGFVFVRVRCSEETRLHRLKSRSDLSSGDEKNFLYDQIVPDLVIENQGSVSELARAVNTALGRFL